MKVKLYRCTPMDAWLTPEGCAANVERASAAVSKRATPNDRLAGYIEARHCPGCCGLGMRSRVVEVVRTAAPPSAGAEGRDDSRLPIWYSHEQVLDAE